MRVRLSILFAVVVVMGCTSFRRNTTGGWLSGVAVPAGPSIYLMTIPDGSEREDGLAHGSGALMTAAVRDALIGRGLRISPGSAGNVDEACREAQAAGLAYVLKGNIPEWEDNATAWSSRPDSAALSLEFYDASTRQLVATATHRTVGSSVSLVSSSPDRFVPELADHALARILKGRPRVFYE